MSNIVPTPISDPPPVRRYPDRLPHFMPDMKVGQYFIWPAPPLSPGVNGTFLSRMLTSWAARCGKSVKGEGRTYSVRKAVDPVTGAPGYAIKRVS